MTDPLTLAARALCKAQSDCYDDLPPEAQADARETVRAVLASLWQPIDTAPKDGTPILVYGGDSHDYGADILLNDRPTVVWWDAESQLPGSLYTGHGELGMWRYCSYDSGIYGGYVGPTHWMPLPDTSLIETQEGQDGSQAVADKPERRPHS